MESVSVRTAGQEIFSRSRHAQVCVAGMVYVYQTGAVSAIQNILGKIAGKNDAQMTAVAVLMASAMPTSVFVIINILDRTVLRRGARKIAARVGSVSTRNAAARLDSVVNGVKSAYVLVELNLVMVMEGATRRMESVFATSSGRVWHAMCPHASVVEYGISRRKSVNAIRGSLVRTASY